MFPNEQKKGINSEIAYACGREAFLNASFYIFNNFAVILQSL